MSEVAKSIGFGRRIVRAIDSIINLAALTVILLLVAIAAYAIWDSDQVYQAADAKQYAVFKPAEENTISFDELREINPEVFAWLTVYGTQIDYPVAQGPDNMKYVNTGIYGEYSLSGAIFLDASNDTRFMDFNSILYGHHMEQKAMFGELGAFNDKRFFDDHRFGNLFYDGKDHGIEFFAFLKTDAYDGLTFSARIEGPVEQQIYLNHLLKRAVYTRDIGVTMDDHILLLTTCATDATNGRDILVARITNELYDDPFALEDTGDTGIRARVDAQAPLWERMPQWAWTALAALLILLIGIAIGYTWGKRRRGSD